ncbi:MAG TPA: hypothetical protein VFA45_09100 [Actinomycetes bacterium]|jgi:hypothetical protein|nr:hypothetical protein [Actinomycetes bacterium]
MSTMRPTRSIALTLTAGLALLMASIMSTSTPSAAASSGPFVISLGAHTFGHLATPQAIVAKAGANQVGWEAPPPGADGPTLGPWSFYIARDGSVWLLDEVNQRLLVWQPGRPDRPARTVPLPFKAAGDLVLGTDGTIYVTSMAAGLGDYLYALTPTGQVRWKTLLPEQRTAGILLVVDSIVYYHFTTNWTPMTDSHGQPLPDTEQRRLARPHQPLPGGLRLTETPVPPHELRLGLIDKAGHTVRAWRITSQVQLGGLTANAAMVHDDLVVALSVDDQARNKALWEYLVLRLPATGGTSVRFAIAPDSRVMWGSELMVGLRVGPDGKLYQLRTNRTTGVRIARYSLDPESTPPTTVTPGGGTVPPSTVSPPPATKAPAPTVTAPAPTTPPLQQPTTPSIQPQPTTPSAQTRSVWRSLAPWLAALTAVALAAAAEVWWWRRRRHRHQPAGPGQPHPAD